MGNTDSNFTSIAYNINSPGSLVFSQLQANTEYYFRFSITDIGGVVTNSIPWPVITFAPVCAASICKCSPEQIRCANGTCVDSLVQCAPHKPVCPSSHSYLCANQTCVSSFRECTLSISAPCAGTLCWDGECAINKSCSIMPSCPFITRRCPNGECVASNLPCERSCNATVTLCADGSCPPCFSTYGCPLTFPVLCPNGQCAENNTACRFNCSEGEYQCYDGSCQTDFSLCATSPRLNHPLSFDYYLPQQNSSNQNENLSVPLLSTATLSLIAEIALPYTLFAEKATDSRIFDVLPVADSELFAVNGSAIWGANTTYSESIMSAVLRLSFIDTDTSNFPSQVKVTFNNTIAPGTNTSNLCLAFINTTTSPPQWQCESDIEVREDGTLVGYTSHFTDFAVLLGSVHKPHVNILDPGDFDDLKNIKKNTIAAYVLAGIVFVYLIGLIFTIPTDRRHQRYANMYNDNRGKSMSLSDLTLSAEVPQNGLVPSPSRRMLLQRDKEGIKDENGKKLGLRKLIFSRARFKHSWLAVFWSPVGAPVTRTSFLTLLLCMILGNLLISAAFYQYNDDTGIAQRVITGVIVACVVFPITLILSLIFRKMPKKFWYISYVIAYSFCAVAIIVTLVYTLKFGTKKSNAWLTSIAISTGQDGAINQPIKLVLSSILLLFFPTAWFSALLL